MNVSPDGNTWRSSPQDRLTAYDNKGFEEMYSYDPGDRKV